VRYSAIELDDKTAVDPILGGNAKNVMLGATYYMNTNHKLLFNVGWVDNNDNAKPNKEYAPLPTGTSTTQTAVRGDNFRIFSIRYQLAF
jgi:predicted porin